MKITKVSEPTENDFNVLKNGLNGFNLLHAGPLNREKISSFAKDDAGNVIGGIVGEIVWGWLYIEGLWVGEFAREQGLGSTLLSQLETYAETKGIFNFRLETTSFQALDFYKKQGYEVFGELPDMPPTFTSYFLKKQVED